MTCVKQNMPIFACKFLPESWTTSETHFGNIHIPGSFPCNVNQGTDNFKQLLLIQTSVFAGSTGPRLYGVPLSEHRHF